MKRIAQRLTRIKQRFGSPFNVTRVDIIENIEDWPRVCRSVALTKEPDGSVSVRFAGDGRTAERFVELAKEALADHRTSPSEEADVAFVVYPRTNNQPTTPTVETRDSDATS